MMCVNDVYVLNEISAGYDKNWEISPHDVTKVGDFYNGGIWGNSLFFVGSSWHFVSDYIKNGLHVSCKFQLELAKTKSYRQKAIDKLIWNTVVYVLYVDYFSNYSEIFITIRIKCAPCPWDTDAPTSPLCPCPKFRTRNSVNVNP